MQIEVRWLDDSESILVETFPKKWDLQDYYNLVDEAAKLLQQRDYIVDLILDFTTSGQLPINIMNGLNYAEKQVPNNQGTVILLNPHPMINMFVKISQDMNMKVTSQVFVANSMKAAQQIIEEQRLLRFS